MARRGLKAATGPGALPGRVEIRFGLWVAATVLLTVAAMVATTLLHGGTLGGADLHGAALSLAVGVSVCLPASLAAGFWIGRTLARPLDSMAAAAQRISQGDLTVRAEPGPTRNEMTAMVRRFNVMADALERNERERRTTAAAISHELRTPLTILCARLHAACDGVIAPSVAEFRHLLDQAEHLTRLVDDLHTLSMADGGRLPLRREPLDLVALVRDTLLRHAHRLAQHGIEAELVLPAGPVLVSGDVGRLRQVLSNLIENATRHARAGGWLELGVAEADGREPGWALLTVSDASPGAVDAVRRHLERRFGDPERPQAAAGGGSGLGLSIVKMLVEQHRGSIAVEASARGGTRFTVRLPLASATPDQDELGAGVVG